MILALNVVAPSTTDVRVIKYVVQVIPQVRGRVIEVPVEPNRLVKKGELLFRIDPTQYQNDLNVARAKLAADEAKFAQAGAGLVGCVGGRAGIAGATEVRHRSGPGAAAAGWSLHGCGSGKTGNWWRRAPATSSHWNRPRPT